MKKEYQNVGVQKHNLIKNKNIDESTIIDDVFNEKTYLNLINPYSDLIAIGRNIKGKHIYASNNSFTNYVECNILDHTISLALHQYISCFEKRLRCYIMHIYSQKIKRSGDKQTRNISWINDFLLYKNVFDLLKLNEAFQNGLIVSANSVLISKREKAFNQLLTAMNITKVNKNTMAEHYKNKYGYIPFFVAIHSLSLGDLVCLFGLLPKNEKIQFITDLNRISFRIISDNKITKFERKLKRINDIRNIVNHYEPIFPLILGTNSPTFSALIDVFTLLKNNYNLTNLKAVCVISLKQLSITWNSYTNNNHRKIEAVVNCLK